MLPDPTHLTGFVATQNRTTSLIRTTTAFLEPYYSPLISPATMSTALDDNPTGADQNDGVKAKVVEESDVGILCYISPLPGFRAILKQRYSDFIVNEVDSDGNVVHLTSLIVPPQLAEKEKEEEEKEGDEQIDKRYTQEIEAFRSLAGDSDADCLKEYLEKINAAAAKDKDFDPLVFSPSSDKLHRTALHKFFKEKLKFLETDTIDGPTDTTKCIRVRLKLGGNQNRGRQNRKRKDRNDKPFDRRNSHDWQEHLGKFLRFNLYKENKDTQEALRVIGKMLGVQPRSFGFSGTKDKRSVSTQRVTMFKQHASRLASLNEKLIGIKVGDFCYVQEGLQLGQLMGNRFTITLRGVVSDSEDTVKESAYALGKHGFINYFGLQRFGSGSIPTHLIGAALLRGEWKAAVDLILGPREGEREAIGKIREYYKESNDVEGTLRRLPYNMIAERAILQCLKNSPGNYQQALKAIPRTLRMMYVHSYQSYLWNHAASSRVQKHGSDRVVVGDLVYCKEDSSQDVFQVECEVGGPNEAYDGNNLEEVLEVGVPDEKNIPVKTLDEEDVLKQKYTIEDVVLPLPGSRVIYPANDVANVYHDLASKDNISLTESIHNVKEFSITSMSGAYRRVYLKPMDFQWEILKYTEASVPLADTDLDILAKTESGKILHKKDTTDGSHTNSSDTANVSENCEGATLNSDSEVMQTALKLSFTLPASCYATMAIRELLKTSTSVAFHKTLNDQV